MLWQVPGDVEEVIKTCQNLVLSAVSWWQRFGSVMTLGAVSFTPGASWYLVTDALPFLQTPGEHSDARDEMEAESAEDGKHEL